MQIIKPAKLSLINKTYGFKGNRFAVAVMSFFKLGEENQFVSEQVAWPKMTQAMSDGTMPDLGFVKPRGEFLVTGKAFAPKGETVTKMTISAKLGKKSKKLKVMGDRQWNGLLFAPARLPEPFESMPVNYSRAYGAEDHKPNPLGTGVTKGKYKDPETGMYNLQNIYLPKESTFAGGARSVAGFSPLHIDWPQRGKYQGTYDKKWLDNVHPAFPNDTNEQLFSSAPEDQQFKGFIKPGESYEIVGMNPEFAKIEGKIPDIRGRAFIEHDVEGELEFVEIETNIDTVWFFPEHMLGVVYHRGWIATQDSDGLDVKRLMVASEWSADEPRPIEHYKQVMKIRSNPQTAINHVFNDGQLMPQKTPEQKAAQHKLVAQTKADNKVRSQQISDIKLASLKTQYPDLDLTPPEPEEDEIAEPDPIPQKMIDDGDADLTPFMDYAEAKSNKAKEDAEAKRAEVEAQRAQWQAQSNAPKEEPVEHMQARVHSIVYVQATDLNEKLVLVKPDYIEQMQVDDQQKEQIIQAAHLMQVNARTARQQSPAVSALPLPLPENGAMILRGWVLQLMQQNQSLAGRDLAGVDLSGLDMSSYDMRDVMLEKANLAGTNFSGCQLNGAVFTGATLDGAIFDGAQLNKANFSEVKAKQGQFKGANLSDVMMAEAKFDGCDFTGATLEKVMALKVDMQGCTLDHATIGETHFVEAKLANSQWQQASLNKCIMMQNELPDSNWRGASLHKCIVLQAKASGADFSEVKAEKVQFSNEGDFKSAILAGGSWQVCGFRGLDMSEVDGRSSVFKECDFTETNLTDAMLGESLFDKCIMMKATLEQSDMRKAFLNETSLRKVQINKADLRHVQLQNCDTTEAVINKCKTWGFSAAPEPSIK